MTRVERSGTMSPVRIALEQPVAARRPLQTPALRAAGPVLLIFLVAFPLVALAIDPDDAFDSFVARFHLFSYLGALSFGLVATLVTRRDATNRIGLICAGIAWCFGLSTALDRYSMLGDERGWPAVTWTLWAAQWVWVPGLWAIPTLLALRFPDGRLAGARWRRIEQLAFAGIAIATLGWALSPYGKIDQEPSIDRDNPIGTDVGLVLFAFGAAATAVVVVATFVGFVKRVRRARGDELAQLLWAVVAITATVALVLASLAFGPNPIIPSLGIALLPLAIAVAVLRHSLWDVDLVVRRSLVYGVLTAMILATYVVVVGLTGGLVGRTVGAPLVATGLVALMVQPLRERLQRLANRMLYGDREDPYAALARLGAQLDAAGDRGRLLTDVLHAIVRAFRLQGASISADDEVLASVGASGASPFDVPLALRGERIGTLHVTPHAGDQISLSDTRVLAHLGRHVAAAVHAERLQQEVEASRARLVSAREEERRRIRRDLHDELGPTLAAIAIEVDRANLELDGDRAAASARLDDVARRVRATVGSVRGLVEGLRPAALDDLHLDGAVRELARSLATGDLDVTVSCAGALDDLPAAVDVAAYRIVGEALTNVVRHAGATRCDVRVVRCGDRLEVEVTDDGRGLRDPLTGQGRTNGPERPFERASGVGRHSMAERAAELGGTVTVSSPTDGGQRGTTVRAVIPIAAP
jgi:signal transduction histidine kinase